MPPLNRCEYSKISIPNDRRFVSIAQQYVDSVASLIGFDPTARKAIQTAVNTAVELIFTHSFEPDEQATLEITCERVPEGLKILLHDLGMPFDPTEPPWASTAGPDDSGPESPLFELHRCMDEVQIKNLGPDGKIISLIKYLTAGPITDYVAACDLEPYEKSAARTASPEPSPTFTVRQMRSTEAVAVSKAIYKTYGYSYPYDYVYYPEKLVELNQTHKLHSAVALLPDNRIAGHCALYLPDAQDQIAEMVQGVVKPEFRSRGCFARLTDYLLKVARERQLTGVYAQPVTNHPFSQHAGHGFGLRDCALLLGHIPIGTQFKGIGADADQKISVLTQFVYLKPPPASVVYAPPHHKDMLERLYRHLGATPRWSLPTQQALAAGAHRSGFEVTVKNPLNLMVIELTRTGKDTVAQIDRKITSLRREPIDVINLYLDLTHPLTYGATAELEKLGFFFAGLLPHAINGRDALILQYLNDLRFDYDRLQLESKMARSLADYIRRRDPHQT